MTFAVIDDDHDRMDEFSKQLFSAFRGIIVYLYMLPLETTAFLQERQVDAVFIEAAMEEKEGTQVLFELRERDQELPVFILADNDEYEAAAMWNDATDYLIRPVFEEKLREVITKNLLNLGERIS